MRFHAFQGVSIPFTEFQATSLELNGSLWGISRVSRGFKGFQESFGVVAEGFQCDSVVSRGAQKLQLSSRNVSGVTCGSLRIIPVYCMVCQEGVSGSLKASLEFEGGPQHLRVVDGF